MVDKKIKIFFAIEKLQGLGKIYEFSIRKNRSKNDLKSKKRCPVFNY